MNTQYDNFELDRADRAIEVKRDYVIEKTADGVYVVMNPDENERCYVVDLTQETCTCPDFWGFCKDKGIECKHLQACKAMDGKNYKKAYLLSDGSVKEKKTATVYVPPKNTIDIETWRENAKKQYDLDDNSDPFGD